MRLRFLGSDRERLPDYTLFCRDLARFEADTMLSRLRAVGEGLLRTVTACVNLPHPCEIEVHFSSVDDLKPTRTLSGRGRASRARGLLDASAIFNGQSSRAESRRRIR